MASKDVIISTKILSQFNIAYCRFDRGKRVWSQQLVRGRWGGEGNAGALTVGGEEGKHR